MEKLTDDNWSYWRKGIYAILKKENVWDIVIGIAPTGADALDSATEEFVAKQEKACGWLVPTISSKLSYLIPNEPDDPAVIWKNLVEHLKSKSAFNVFHLQNQLAQLKLTTKRIRFHGFVSASSCTSNWHSLARKRKTTTNAWQCLSCFQSSTCP